MTETETECPMCKHKFNPNAEIDKEWVVAIPFRSMKYSRALEWGRKIEALLKEKLHLNEVYLEEANKK